MTRGLGANDSISGLCLGWDDIDGRIKPFGVAFFTQLGLGSPFWLAFGARSAVRAMAKAARGLDA
jgi:hypothetical protein